MVSSRAFPGEPQKRLKAWRLAEAILRPAPKLPPDEWARLHRVYPETSGLPGPRDPWLTPYMVPMTRAVHGGAYIIRDAEVNGNCLTYHADRDQPAEKAAANAALANLGVIVR